MSVKVLHTSADAFRWGALGKSPWRVWNALLIDVGTALMTLADRLPGMSRDTVRRSLRRLETHGLARCDEDGLWRRLERDLDEVARELGKGGVGARQREQHAEQRLAYQEAMATRRYREQARGRRPGSDDDRSRRPEGKS